jgi:sporulation protein YlmC with PRC-barrel domain
MHHSDAGEFIIGTDVVGSDGALGELRRVIVDPADRAVTHLVVEPRHRHGTGHLVPIALVSPSVSRAITLRCTSADFWALDPAEETHLAPSAYSPNAPEMLTLPYYSGAGIGAGGMGGGITPHAVMTDLIPAGEVEVQRGDQVHATDGAIGRVQGVQVDDRDHRVTHVLLQEGHLWGRKRVAIPITAVTGVDDGIRLGLTKHEVEDLPGLETVTGT